MAEQQKPKEGPLGGAAAPQQAQSADVETTIDLAELCFRLLGRWKQIIATALGAALIAALITIRFMTPMYSSTSTIYVLSRRDSAINISDLNLGSALTNDYIRVFNMWEVHEQVISNLNLPYGYAKMRGMLSVSNAANTRMIDISVTSPIPEEAAAIANEYARVASQYIADMMSTDKPSIMSVALVPTNPVSPSKTKNILLGFLLGGMFAAGVVTVRYITDDRFKTSDDIRRYTGLITLAVVPMEDDMQDMHPANPPKRRKA